MTTALRLPALDGRTPLGFLAALGVLRLLDRAGSSDREDPIRLSWSAADCAAELHSECQSIPELAAELWRIVESIPEAGVLPGMPPNLPPPGVAPDKMRLPRAGFRDFARGHAEHGIAAEEWMASLVTDLAVDAYGRGAISLWTAPSGKQSMRTMLEKPLGLVRGRPELLTEALIGWRRYAGVTGEYLDNLAVFDAADAPDGRPSMRGVPGATWLALMSFPLFRTVAVGNEPLSTGWQIITGERRVRQAIYPLWSEPLDTDAVMTLMNHPMMAQAAPGAPSANAKLLSIFQVCVAERVPLPGGKSAGLLTPVRTPRDRGRRR